MVAKTKERIVIDEKAEDIVPDEVIIGSEEGAELVSAQPPAENLAEPEPASAGVKMYLLSVLTQNSASTLAELSSLVLAAGSKVEKAEDLGVKHLAFPINKHLELSLISVFFKADNQIIKALDSELKHTDSIERYLLTTWRAGLEDTKRRVAERQKAVTNTHV